MPFAEDYCRLLDTYDIFFFLFFSFSQVATAVKFLQNPKVRQSPLATRKAFLKKKGEFLTRRNNEPQTLG